MQAIVPDRYGGPEVLRALVVFSSMANQISGLVGMGTEFYADKITVTDGVAFGTSPMRLTDADAIASVAGVAAADPRVEVFWESDPAVGFSVPDTITGLIPGADAGYESFELEVATGRLLTVDDAGDVVVLGSDLAREHNVLAGDSIAIRDRAFEVIGTLQQTFTAPDTIVASLYIPIMVFNAAGAS